MHNRKLALNRTDCRITITEKQWTEKQLVDLVSRFCKGVKAKFLKFHSNTDTGWMDRIIMGRHGGTVWAEFKKPGKGKLAPLQAVNREWLISNGHRYYLLDTYEKCIRFINEVLPYL